MKYKTKNLGGSSPSAAVAKLCIPPKKEVPTLPKGRGVVGIGIAIGNMLGPGTEQFPLGIVLETVVLTEIVLFCETTTDF